MIRTLRIGCYALAVLVALAVGTMAALAAAALLVTALTIRPLARTVSSGRGLAGRRAAQAAGATRQGSTTLSTQV